MRKKVRKYVLFAFGILALAILIRMVIGKQACKLSLSNIETTMQTDIDKANRMLDNIRPERLSKKEQADYCRMKASCSARLFMQWNKADSLNSMALNYYRQTNDTANLKKSLYLSGQINLNRNEPDRAIECFSELEKMAFQEKQRPYQAHLNYLLSRCYIEKKDDNAAIQYSKNAIACADEQDSARLAYYCKETGALYAQTNAVDSAWAYYRKAMDIYMQQEELTRVASLMFNDMAQWLLSKQDYKEALEYAEKSMQYRASRKDASLFNLTKARIFIALNETDSARLYLNRTIESSENNYLTIMAYRHLSDLYKAEGDYEQAFRKLLNYDGFMKDAQSNIDMNLLIRQYKEVQLENENNTLKLAKRNRELELLSVIFLATVAGVVFWYFYSLAKKKEKMRIQQQREQDLKNQARIAEQENRLLKQEKELSQLNEKAAVLRESLFRKLTVSEKIPSLDVSGHHENGNSHKKIALEESDWKELVETIDAVFNGFSSRLKKAYPQLSIDDVRFCCLLKINVSLQDLADIYCISKAGITKRKMRMKKEKFDIIDNQLDLNEFLIRY